MAIPLTGQDKTTFDERRQRHRAWSSEEGSVPRVDTTSTVAAGSVVIASRNAGAVIRPAVTAEETVTGSLRNWSSG